MKLTVKTLKGAKFEVQVDDSNTVEQVKGIIASKKPELPADSQKLIHSGKVLKDDNVISTCGIKPNDFLVVMVTKPKKEPAAVAEAAAVSPAPAAAAATTTTLEAEATTPAAATSSPTPAAPPAAFPGAAAPDNALVISDETVGNLTAMGFPEPEVRHCLQVAHGNPDIAVEFLTNGIPESVAQAAAMVATTTAGTGAGAATLSSSSSPGQTRPLQALRSHPQFNDLRRLVQSNPQMLQQVLGQIGQQQPELLQEINANQALFLEMMNEPVTEPTTTTTTSTRPAVPPTGTTTTTASNAMPGGLEAMGNPAQMAQMIQNMSPAELEQMAQIMGLSPVQLQLTAQMLGQMPPEQLQQFMMQAVGSSGTGSNNNIGGGGNVIRLTQEEMAAVDRLTEMGFDRSEAAQAFLACDKNEALAANLLMDSMGDGGFFGDDSGGGNNDNNDNNDAGNGGDGEENDGDDMYD